MESEVQEILTMAEAMQKKFNALEKRQTFSAEKYKAVKDAANTLRWYRGVGLSLLRAAFDPVYAGKMKKLTAAVKNSDK